MRRFNPPSNRGFDETGYSIMDLRTYQELRAERMPALALSQRAHHSSRELTRETTLFAYDWLKKCRSLRSLNLKNCQENGR